MISLRRQMAGTRSVQLAIVAAVVIVLAFAAPVLGAFATGIVPHNEPKFGRAIVVSFGGLSLPILGATIAGVFFAIGSAARARADRLVAAGLEPRQAVLAPAALAVVSAAVPAAIVGVVIVVTLRLVLHLGDARLIGLDALGTAWALVLGAAAWTSLALMFVAGSGRPARGFVVVAFDLGTRLLPGGVAWLAPSTHVANLLGDPPPRGFVHTPALSQGGSVAAILVIAVFAFAWAVRRYEGAPAA